MTTASFEERKKTPISSSFSFFFFFFFFFFSPSRPRLHPQLSSLGLPEDARPHRDEKGALVVVSR